MEYQTLFSGNKKNIIILLCAEFGVRMLNWGWLGVEKVSCIVRHWGIQLILAYSWARLAILVAGKGRGVCFYFFSFIPVPLSSLSLSFISSTMSSISSRFLWEPTQNARDHMSLNPNTINQVRMLKVELFLCFWFSSLLQVLMRF